jgi:hypothetical protein
MDLKLGDTRLIINAAKAADLLRNQCAYVLATAYHETAHTMKPITEMGNQKYLRGKKYWPFIGRGYVQLTWKTNYADWSKRLGVDLVAKPELALDPVNAVRILVEGMQLGTFTKKKLADYITLTSSDFVGARRIINGTDQKDLIAGYAKQYDTLLAADGYGVAPPAVVIPLPTAQPPVQLPDKPVVVEVPKDGDPVVKPATPVPPAAQPTVPQHKTGLLTFVALAIAAIAAWLKAHFGG